MLRGALSLVTDDSQEVSGLGINGNKNTIVGAIMVQDGSRCILQARVNRVLD